MDPIYVTGHRNPDTDSIVSAMAYAALCNALGENGYVPARLGHLNDESNFLLRRFGFQPPMMLSTVRTQVRDIDFDRPPLLGINVPVSHAWKIIRENPSLNSLPVTNEDGTSYVLVPGEGKEGPQHRAVLTGETDGNYIQIVSGLEEGETYYDTAQGLFPEMNVEVSGPGGGDEP